MKKGAFALSGLAVFGQFLGLFPFAVIYCAIGEGGFSAGIFFEVYAFWIVFYVLGYFASKISKGVSNSKRKAGAAVFLSRAFVIVPVIAAVFIASGINLKLFALASVLPACIAAYFGAYASEGLSYSQKFSKGWFVAYLVSAVVSSFFMWAICEAEIRGFGNQLLCGGFAVMAAAVAVTANQTAVDAGTRRRHKYSSRLPAGMRLKNGITAGVLSFLFLGLALFSRQIADFFIYLARIFFTVSAFLLNYFSSCVSRREEEAEIPAGEEAVTFPKEFPEFWNFIYAVIIAVGVALIIRFRHEIWRFLKELTAPLFKRNNEKALPFYDEVFDINEKKSSRREKQRAVKSDFRRYKKETSPEKKYRLGYAIFLRRLALSDFPPESFDTTELHAKKANRAFSEDGIDEQKEVYERLRYGGITPTDEEISRQEKLLYKLRK